MKKLLKKVKLRTIWTVLAGFLPGVLVGGVIAILGLFLFSPEPNIPPPAPDNAPGDVTIQLSRSYLNNEAAQKLQETGIPVLGAIGNVQTTLQSNAQLFIQGDVVVPLTGITRQVMIYLQACVASNGKPALIVMDVRLGGQSLPGFVKQSVQDRITSSFSNVNLSIPNEHLARILTTSSAMILVYTSGSSGSGQPAC